MNYTNKIRCNLCFDFLDILHFSRDKSKQFCDDCMIEKIKKMYSNKQHTYKIDILIDHGKLPEYIRTKESFCFFSLLNKNNETFDTNEIEYKFNPLIINNVINKITNLIFTDELVYSNKISKEININNSNIPNISQINFEKYLEMKKYSKRGFYQGVTICYDDKLGNYVVATSYIPKHSIICEYVGEVYQKIHSLLSENDSIYELTIDMLKEKSVVIIPEIYCNIGKFICGINNFKNDYNKVNVKAEIFKIYNQNKILIYTIRDIYQNEILYLDYNGHSNIILYDTKNFI